jgi:hypothetical protein
LQRFRRGDTQKRGQTPDEDQQVSYRKITSTRRGRILLNAGWNALIGALALLLMPGSWFGVPFVVFALVFTLVALLMSEQTLEKWWKWAEFGSR